MKNSEIEHQIELDEQEDALWDDPDEELEYCGFDGLCVYREEGKCMCDNPQPCEHLI